MIKIYEYDAFTKKTGMGNPAGIVTDCSGLAKSDMQEIAAKAEFSETAFILPADDADLELKFFSPGKEMKLCGHATIASLVCMYEHGVLNKNKLTVKTLAGILPIEIYVKDGDIFVIMTHAAPEFKCFSGDISGLCASIGINVSEIDDSMPLLYASTGTWTLLLPVKNLEICKKMKPQNKLFPDILKELPDASVHPFCMEAFSKSRHMHSRHFSTPASGVVEDYVTGTASGAMAAYYAEYIAPEEREIRLILEQGQELGKDGEVYTYTVRNGSVINVSISGTAVKTRMFNI